jgi:hypothetical protein
MDATARGPIKPADPGAPAAMTGTRGTSPRTGTGRVTGHFMGDLIAGARRLRTKMPTSPRNTPTAAPTAKSRGLARRAGRRGSMAERQDAAVGALQTLLCDGLLQARQQVAVERFDGLRLGGELFAPCDVVGVAAVAAEAEVLDLDLGLQQVDLQLGHAVAQPVRGALGFGDLAFYLFGDVGLGDRVGDRHRT